MPRRTPSFCPYCGRELSTRRIDERERAYCVDCEEVIWQDAATIAHVAVVEGSRVFLQKRAVEPGSGMWGFPAGYLDADETPQEGGARELAEETGLDVDPTDLTIVDVGVESDEGAHARWFFLSVHRSETTGPVELGAEASEWGFFAPDEFAETDGEMSEKYREWFDLLASGPIRD